MLKINESWEKFRRMCVDYDGGPENYCGNIDACVCLQEDCPRLVKRFSRFRLFLKVFTKGSHTSGF
jgi:hypothetical protein